MATYRDAHFIGKPPPWHTLTAAAEDARASMRAAGEARLAAVEAPPIERNDLRAGPHPRPAWRIDVAALAGTAKTVAKTAHEAGLRTEAATDGRLIALHVIGLDGYMLGEAWWMGSRFFGAKVYDPGLGAYRPSNVTAFKAAVLEAVES